MNCELDDNSILTFYKCLAEETRLKSLLLLQLKKELCVCDLMNALQLSQPKVSRHLADLRKCGMVVDERRGKWVYYRINKALPKWALTVLRESAKQAQGQYLLPSLQLLDQTLSETSCL